MTYARRYGLAAICNISADEDDDGNAVASNATPQQQEAIYQHPRNPDKIDLRFFDWPPGAGKYADTPKSHLREELRQYKSRLDALTPDDKTDFIEIIMDPDNRSLLARIFEIWPDAWFGVRGEQDRSYRNELIKLADNFNIIFLPNGTIDPQG